MNESEQERSRSEKEMNAFEDAFRKIVKSVRNLKRQGRKKLTRGRPSMRDRNSRVQVAVVAAAKRGFPLSPESPRSTRTSTGQRGRRAKIAGRPTNLPSAFEVVSAQMMAEADGARRREMNPSEAAGRLRLHASDLRRAWAMSPNAVRKAYYEEIDRLVKLTQITWSFL